MPPGSGRSDRVSGRDDKCDRNGGDQERAAEGADEVVVDLVAETGRRGEIGSVHPTEIERAAVREDQPVPGNEHAVLTESDAAVVLTDQPTSLRDQKKSPGAAVVDIAPDESRRLARQVGVDAR